MHGQLLQGENVIEINVIVDIYYTPILITWVFE